MKVTFRLRSPQAPTSSITASIYSLGRKFQLATGIRVSTAKWDIHKERLAPLEAVDLATNSQLDSFAQRLLNATTELSNSGDISLFKLKSEMGLNSARQTQIQTQCSLTYFRTYIDNKCSQLQSTGNKTAPATIRRLTSLENALEVFQHTTGVKLSFDFWNRKGMEKFVAYRSEQGRKASTIASDLRNIKSSLRRAHEEGLHDNRFCYSPAFVVKFKKPAPIALTIDEVRKLKAFHATGPKEAVRVAFLLGVYTGLRKSDLPAFIEAVKGNQAQTVTITQRKTGEHLTVPVSKCVRGLLSDYPEGFNMPTTDVIQDYIKRIAQEAGLDRPVQRASTTAPLYTLVTFHTSRRTFATRLYIDSGLTAREVMAFTGHKSETSLLRYLDLDRKQAVLVNAHKLGKLFE